MKNFIQHFRKQTSRQTGEQYYDFQWHIAALYVVIGIVILVSMAVSGFGRPIPDFLIWLIRMGCILSTIVVWLLLWHDAWEYKQYLKRKPVRPSTVRPVQPGAATLYERRSRVTLGFAALISVICVVIFVISMPFHVM